MLLSSHTWLYFWCTEIMLHDFSGLSKNRKHHRLSELAGNRFVIELRWCQQCSSLCCQYTSPMIKDPHKNVTRAAKSASPLKVSTINADTLYEAMRLLRVQYRVHSMVITSSWSAMHCHLAHINTRQPLFSQQNSPKFSYNVFSNIHVQQMWVDST